MTWNTDISAAPRDGTHVILAMPNKTTLRSYWVECKHEPSHWCMQSHKVEPVAWMAWPKHPYEESPQQQGTDGGEIAEVKAKSRLANATGVEPSPSEQSTAANQGEAAVSPAPMNVSLPDTDERSGEGANAGGPDEVTGSNAHPQTQAVEPVSSSTDFVYLEDAGSGQ